MVQLEIFVKQRLLSCTKIVVASQAEQRTEDDVKDWYPVQLAIESTQESLSVVGILLPEQVLH